MRALTWQGTLKRSPQKAQDTKSELVDAVQKANASESGKARGR
jgi:hypothetical protein